MHFSKTLVDLWRKERNEDHDRRAYLRVGQDFFNSFKLHKAYDSSHSCRHQLEQLYELDGAEAFKVIESMTDHQQ